MNAEQMLEKYILGHPDYWEFENEAEEVSRLKELCKIEANSHDTSCMQNESKLCLCA